MCFVNADAHVPEGFEVGTRYTIVRRMDSGAFGTVFEGRDIFDNVPVCIKLEPLDAPYPQLNHEANVYKLLNPRGSAVGVPKFLWQGQTVRPDHNAIVLELLGPSLEDQFNH
eukprot:EG_transcript_32735